MPVVGSFASISLSLIFMLWWILSGWTVLSVPNWLCTHDDEDLVGIWDIGCNAKYMGVFDEWPVSFLMKKLHVTLEKVYWCSLQLVVYKGNTCMLLCRV